MKDPTAESVDVLSRRKILHWSACAAVGMTFSALLGDGPARASFARGKEVVREFPFGAVRLTGGLLKQQFDRIHRHYLALSND